MEENRLKQRRVSFSDPPSQPIVEDEAVIRDDNHGNAVAAAALAIYSLEQAELLNLKKMKEGHVSSSSTQTMRREEESISRKPSYASRTVYGGLTFTGGTTTAAAAVTISLISLIKTCYMDCLTPFIGGSWKKKSFRENHEEQFPLRLSSAGQSPSPPNPMGIARYQKHKESHHTPTQQNTVNSKAESWKMDKIHKRYEKIKFKILVWEGENKMQAILQKDRTKNELEQKRAMAMLHYLNKIAMINRIAQRARAKLEDKRRKEESKVKEKIKKHVSAEDLVTNRTKAQRNGYIPDHKAPF